MMKRLSLILAATILLAGCHGKAKTADLSTQDVNVTTVAVQTGVVDETLTANGTVIPANEVKVMPKTAGRISWAVVEGTRVSAGESIATLELPELASQLGIQQAALEMARTNRESAKTNLGRMRSLFGQGGISAQQLDGAQTQADVAARQVESARAAINSLKTQLNNGAITAPFAGIVTSRYTDVGGMASPNAPLFNLAKLGRLQVKLPISEKDLGKIKLGLKASVSSSAYPGKTFSARLSEISPAIDPTSRLLNLKLDLQEGADRLKLGMFVTASLSCASHPGLMLPASAVLADGPDSIVYKADGLKAKKVQVAIGVRDGDRLEIVSGLKNG
ncbi:MAG TPA: efflux RND transporter periplasmic adaptor subunit, partial [Chroococcales cyanobacterium]